MKSVLLFPVFFLISTSGESQTNKRIPLVEHFTNTYCVICAGRNPPLYEVMDKYGDDVHHISYFPSVPYSQCPLYNYNRAGNGAREAYYQIPFTPRVFIDGQAGSNTPSTFDTGIAARASIDSPIGISVNEFDDGRTKSARIEIVSSANTPAGDYRLFVALVERKLEFAANNGENEHFNVFREMLTEDEGTTIALPAEGESMEKNFSISVPEELNLSELYILAYVQDLGTGEVLNSGSRFSQSTTAIYDQQESTVKVFPNPASEQVNILSQDQTIRMVVIMDALGRDLISILADDNSNALTLATRHLTSGSYWLKIQFATGQVEISSLRVVE